MAKKITSGLGGFYYYIKTFMKKDLTREFKKKVINYVVLIIRPRVVKDY